MLIRAARRTKRLYRKDTCEVSSSIVIFFYHNIIKLYNDIYSALNICITFLVDGTKYSRIIPLNTFKKESYAYTINYIQDFLNKAELRAITLEPSKLKVLSVTCIYNIEVYLKINES